MASSDVRPGTSASKGGVPAGRPDSNGARRGSTTATKTKSNMAKKALIVSDRWGPSIHGGITDALHIVIKLLQDMGISVHCTALKATKKEEAEAKKLGVTLELPTQTGVFEFREPHSDWLLYHNEHFPDLEELTNVKFVFGFSAFTSIPTFKILRKVFPKASCYLINLFDKDDITPLIVGCSKEELEFRKRIMSDEFKNAKCSFSVGERVHAEYSQLYHSTNQQLLSPMINEEYLAASKSDKPPILKREKFKIISVVQEYELEDPEKLDVAIKAVNDAAELIYQFNKTPSVWKIIGIPPRKEKEVAKKLTRSSRLKITPKIVTSTEELNSELMSSHLVLIPPSTTSYGNLTLAAMCAAIPVVYPEGSHSDEIVSKHIDMLEATECAIDMEEDPEDLQHRIVSVITKYPTAFQRAKIIRDHIKEKVAQDLRDSNGSFVASITADMQSTSPHGDDQDTETESTVEHKGNGAKISDDGIESKVSDRKNEADAEKDEVNTAVTELPTEELTAGRADDKEHLSGASVDQESKPKAEQPGSDGDMAECTSDKNLSSGRIRRKRKAGKIAVDVGKSRKSDRKDKKEKEDVEVNKAEQPGSDGDIAESTSDKNISSGRIRRKRK
ncbi:uncharacterized protein [Ptychodera flava]|uniref:uncharacterized protein n=1 Tax=Ptychodera flava TaxID=63121 RepID=UPI003969C80C